MSVRLVKNHLVFATDLPEQLLTYIPHAKVQPHDGRHLCAIPHSLDDARVLKNIRPDWNIPSPIRTEYDWPGRYKPLPHQIETAEFLTLHKRAFCLNAMGTMKTASTIWAVDYIMKAKDVNRCLIVAPLSTLERVWVDELFRLVPRRSVAVLHGSREKRRRLLAIPHDFYIINHDGLGVIVDDLKDRDDIDHVVIDEVATYRHQRTTRFKVINEVVNKQVPRSCWGLTGAPTPNEPTDAYSQSRLICPNNYRGSFKTFKEETMFQVNTFRWLPKKHAVEVVNNVLKPSIRFSLEDCVDLPPTIYQDRVCELSSEQKHHYKALMNDQVTAVGGAQVTAVNAAVLIGKLVQAACGVLYDENGGIVKIDFGPRLSLLMEILEECEQKAIIFVPLTGVIVALEEHIKKHYTTAIVDGSVGKSKRDQIFRDFQNAKDPRILIANAGTMSHGLTLTAATSVIWYAPTNNNDTYNQANMRIPRPGQKNVTNIIHMYATPAERRIYEALREKTRLQDVVLTLARGDR